MLRKLVLSVAVFFLLAGQVQGPALSPNSGKPGQALQVQLKYPSSPADLLVSFSPAGLTVSNEVRVPGAVNFTLSIASTANPGKYAMVLNSVRGQLKDLPVPNAFTVLAAPGPVLRLIQPGSITAGAPATTVAMTVDNARPGTSVQITGTGVTASVVSQNGPLLKVSVLAAATAAPGVREVVIKNVDGTSNQGQGPPARLTVLPAKAPDVPVVREASPDSIAAGEPAANVTITGINFRPGAQVTLTGGGTKVTVLSQSANTIIASIGATTTAAAGPRLVIVTNPDGTSNSRQSPPAQIAILAPRVVAPPSAPAVPVVREASPSAITAGEPPISVRITGINFRPGARVTLSGSGANANVVSESPDAIVAMIGATATATPDLRAVYVTNSDGTSNSRQSPPALIAIVAPRVVPPAAPGVPVVRQITPNSFVAGGPATPAQITGINFRAGASLNLGNGVRGTVVSVTDNAISASVQVSPDAPPGPRDVVVTNSDGTSNASQSPPVQFNVTAPRVVLPSSPIIRSISPSTITAGDPAKNVQITGANFRPGATLRVAGDVSATITSVSGNLIVASLSAPATCLAGTRPVVVTNTDGTNNDGQGPPAQVTVLAAAPPEPRPVFIRSIVPSTIIAGSPAATVRLTGTGFQPGARLSVSGGGVEATIVSVEGPNAAVASIAADAEATAGSRTVTLTNPDGTSNASQLPPAQITISSQPPPKQVLIRSIVPNTINAGAPATTVQISGIGFEAGARLSVSGAGIQATIQSVNGPNSATASIVADGTASAGPRTVILTNPDGTSNVTQVPPAQIIIIGPAVIPPSPKRPPVIVSITPSNVPIAQKDVPISISGAGFQPGARLTIEGPGVSFKSVNVLSANSASAVLSVLAVTIPGPRVVTLTNPDGSSTAAQQPQPRINLTTAALPSPPGPKPPGPTPPTNVLLAPRIDLVTPQRLEPGQQYKIAVQGRNLTPEARINLGDGVTIVGTPFVTSPTAATMTVMVSPSAQPGSRPAAVSNKSGSSNGPGGILIASAEAKPKPKQNQPPVKAQLPPEFPKHKFKQATGNIILEYPYDPDSGFGLLLGNPPQTLTQATTFSWREENPGIAKVFVFEIVDGGGKVLFSAQTKQKYLNLTASNLASLPKLDGGQQIYNVSSGNSSGSINAPGGIGATPPGGTFNQKPVGPSGGGKPGAGATAGKGGTGGTPKPSAPKARPGDTKGLTKAMEESNPNREKKGGAKAAEAGRKPELGEVYWRVRGLGAKIDEITGLKTSEIIQLEDSTERPIVLPLPPNGLTCSNTKGSKLGGLKPTTVKGMKLTKPCSEGSTNICSGVQYAVLDPTATIDLSRVPFAIHSNTGGATSRTFFQNVFLDWGDGSDPKPLILAADGTSNLNAVVMADVSYYKKQGHYHVYKNKDTDAEFVKYNIRVFMVADQDTTPPMSVAMMSSAGAQSNGSLTASGKGIQASNPASNSGIGASKPAATSQNSIDSSIFTVACTEVKIYNPQAAGVDEPLHLLTADVVFPGEDEKGGLFDKGATAGTAKPKSSSSSGKPAAGAVGGGVSASVNANASNVGNTIPNSAIGTPFELNKASLARQKLIPKDNKGPVPEISDCSVAFKAAVRVTYWGHGKARIHWFVDDVEIEAKETSLPPVSTADGLSGKKPQDIVMVSVLPAALQATPHRVTVRVESTKKKAPAGPTAEFIDPSQADVIASADTDGMAGDGQKVFGPNAGAPGKSGFGSTTPKGPGSAPKGSGFTMGPSQHSGTEVNVTVKNGGTSQGREPGGPPNYAANAVYEAPPDSEASSPNRYYFAVNHKELGVPCRLRYMTASTGIFYITDLVSLTKGGETQSGGGMLNIFFPASASGSLSPQPLPVKFSGWKLVPSKEADDDTLDVASGTLDFKPSNGDLKALNAFDVHIDHVTLNSTQLALDGNVAVNEAMGFKVGSGEELPQWTFTKAPMTSDGDFYFVSPVGKSQTVSLLATGFDLRMSGAQVDFSQKKGGPPEQSCSAQMPDEKWMGIRLTGTLLAPAALSFNNEPAIKDYPVTNWGLVPSGLNVSLADPKYTKALSSSKVKIVATNFQFQMCKEKFNAGFDIEVRNAPLVLDTFKGKLQINDTAIVTPIFSPMSVTHDWGTVAAKISNAEFLYDSDVGNFVVKVNSSFKFKTPSTGKVIYEHEYPDIKVRLDGNITIGEKTAWFPVPDAGMANISGFPMQVTQLGLGNSSDGSGIWVGFKGDLTVGDNAPVVPDKEAVFKLKIVGDSASNRSRTNPDYQLASFGKGPFAGDAEGAESLDYDSPDQGSGYSTSETDGIQVDKVHLKFDYPPGSGTVQVLADCEWQSSGGGHRFIGNGQVSVAGAIGIQIEANFGRQGDTSYWMVKGMANPLPGGPYVLGSTGLGLYGIGGGLGYNISIASYDTPNVRDIVIDSPPSKAYSFSAAVDVGTLDNFTIYARGRLTVKIGGADAGARLSAQGWLLTADHSGTPPVEACMQYAGGAFDAGAAAHLNLLEGLVDVTAPKSGNDVCTQAAIHIHFGGDGSFVHVGTKETPITIQVLIATGAGYFMVDGNSVATGVTSGFGKRWDVDIAGFGGYVEFNATLGVSLAVNFSPVHVEGHLAGAANFGAGVCVDTFLYTGCKGISFGGAFDFGVSAPPIHICGSISVHIPMPIIDDIDVGVGGLCL